MASPATQTVFDANSFRGLDLGYFGQQNGYIDGGRSLGCGFSMNNYCQAITSKGVCNSNDSSSCGLPYESECKDTIAYIRCEMQKIRQQFKLRNDDQHFLQQQVVQQEQEILQLRNELALSKQNHCIQQGAVQLQINVCTGEQDSDPEIRGQQGCNLRVEQQQVHDTQSHSISDQQQAVTYAYNTGLAQVPLSLTDETYSLCSLTTDQGDLELQVQQLQCELQDKESEVCAARQKESVLQQHIVSMSDKIMQLNTQVQRLQTQLMIQEDSRQAALETLAEAEEELDRRNQELERLSQTSIVGSPSVQVCTEEGYSQQVEVGHVQQQSRPSLVRTQTGRHVQKLQMMLFVTTLLHQIRLAKLQQEMDAQPDTQKITVDHKVRRQLVPSLNLFETTCEVERPQSDRPQQHQRPRSSLSWSGSKKLEAYKYKRTKSERLGSMTPRGDVQLGPLQIIKLNVDQNQAQYSNDRKTHSITVSNGNLAMEELAKEANKEKRKKSKGRFMKIAFILSSIGFAVPKFIQSIRSARCASYAEGRTQSYTSSVSPYSLSS
eukprot:TRINITY_DN8439_c0_g1_i1.p1 TRINITY_DN8439_c0_g1~~TRINITY_DN8439_c0_g1_i1.p1  ORF type:complete len:593 (-),score=32.90 TRINITY_DN8439_c0_g1_i1:1942-3588(-)